MSTMINPSLERHAPPQSNRTRKALEVPRPRSGGWLSAVAAALLLLSLGGGAYLAGNGGFGFGGGNDEGRYAAQVVSPEASPASANAVCDVEPLTTDQIVAYVENPYSYMPDDVFGTPPPGQEGQTLPSIDLIEATEMYSEPPAGQGAVPDEETFAQIEAVASEYLACVHNGTAAQVLTFLRPEEIQYIVFTNLPVYRTEADVRELIESVGDEQYAHLNHLLRPVAPEVRLGQQQTFVNPDLTEARVFPTRNLDVLQDSDMLVYIGQEYTDEQGNVVGRTGWDGTPLVGGSEQTNGGGSLIFVHSESTDRWYFYLHNAPWG